MAENVESYQDNRPADGQLVHVSVEHILGLERGPLVKVTVDGEPAHILRGLLDPAAARQIANDLLLCAARAEYEADLYSGMRAVDFKPEAIASVLHLVRQGEVDRATTGGWLPAHDLDEGQGEDQTDPNGQSAE